MDLVQVMPRRIKLIFGEFKEDLGRFIHDAA
jgi:hypothetical protein